MKLKSSLQLGLLAALPLYAVRSHSCRWYSNAVSVPLSLRGQLSPKCHTLLGKHRPNSLKTHEIRPRKVSQNFEAPLRPHFTNHHSPACRAETPGRKRACLAEAPERRRVTNRGSRSTQGAITNRCNFLKTHGRCTLRSTQLFEVRKTTSFGIAPALRPARKPAAARKESFTTPFSARLEALPFHPVKAWAFRPTKHATSPHGFSHGILRRQVDTPCKAICDLSY